MSFLTFDFSELLKKTLITSTELREAHDRVKSSLEILIDLKKTGKIGFLDLPHQSAIAKNIVKKNRDYKKKFSSLVQCGIGGSSLGAQALVSGLKRDAPVYFLDNVDPLSYKSVQKKLDFSKTLFHIVSKSGDTVETMYQYKWIVSELKKNKLKLNEHILISTEDNDGFLQHEVKAHGYEWYELPAHVGGRFSVLTSAGLVAADFAGLNINKVLEGARSVALTSKSAITECAALSWLLHKKQKRNIVGLMIYADFLEDFGHWLVQLWAESLGKKKSLDGNDVFEGSFPLMGRATPAQHSLLQLFSEGPDQMWFQFIEVENLERTKSNFSKLIHIESKATRESLIAHKRPAVTIRLKNLSEESLGALLFFYECVVALLGLSLNINPFDQPGVEDSKKRIQRYLSLQ